ncbi:MAG TPA: chemotaxis protein CheX [Candidatus Limnocylindrales bacterium]|nr:chemotaxis protein CheX [Candidatus Limnocylindrales bacterium]
MSVATIELKEWLEALTEVMRDYAGRSLKFDGPPLVEARDLSEPRPAAYVAILGERCSLHLGLSSSMGGCRALVRALLGMRQRDPITDAEVVDGMSEILNIAAGKVKSRMVVRDGSLKLGLPMFVQGQVGYGESTERASGDVMIGPVPCQLLVYRRSRS